LRKRFEIDPEKRSFHQLIAEALIKQRAKGNVEAIKVFFERQLGKVRYSDEEPPPTQISSESTGTRRETSPRDGIEH
jgi:hypothetical protein